MTRPETIHSPGLPREVITKAIQLWPNDFRTLDELLLESLTSAIFDMA